MTGWTLLIASHAACASAALVLGAFNLLRRRKGDPLHRTVGWAWAATMAYVSVSSFWIRAIIPGHLSPVHVLSVVTLASLLAGVFFAARRRTAAHRLFMRGAYFGLLGAFLAAVAMPNRLIPRLALHAPFTALAALASTFVAGAVVIGLSFLATRVAGGFPQARRVRPASGE